MKRAIWVVLVVSACGSAPNDVDEAVFEDVETAIEAEPEEIDIVAESDAAAAEEVLLSCGADQVQDLLGTPLETAQSALPDDIRVIPEGGLFTQDYRPERMNVLLDAKQNITRIWCG